MKTIGKNKSSMSFVLNTNESLINAIRRSANEIPIIAIDEVEFHKNDSALYDEILSHRIGLIPIKENRKLNDSENCSCKGKGCNKCQIQVSLKAKGPTTVYSKEIKGDLEVIYDKMPIVILSKDQELQLVGFAKLGKGTKHAKFSPGLIYYRHISNITIKNSEKADKIINNLSDSLINVPKGKIKSGDVFQSYKDLDYIETFIGNDKEVIEVKSGEEIVFLIESWGQLEPKEIFAEAVKVLESNLKEVLKTIKK